MWQLPPNKGTGRRRHKRMAQARRCGQLPHEPRLGTRVGSLTHSRWFRQPTHTESRIPAGFRQLTHTLHAVAAAWRGVARRGRGGNAGRAKYA
jgi:hypothetical protein